MANKQKLQEELDAWTERDLTEAAVAGELEPAFEQDQALERLDRILTAGRCPVVTGDRGVGKTALLHQLVRRAADGEGPPALHGKRVHGNGTLLVPSARPARRFRRLQRRRLGCSPT